ncbi:MAG TPA: class I SAM-dependent methyltransferase [Syntrophomonadaceae bacterium]|nr:class I SAM-dependent methyltransferase [Syntrophomonadaceae bacterium]
MKDFFLKNALEVSHLVMQKELQKGSVAIDATCGKGNDTLFLVDLLGETGRVFAFDIQSEAIKLTREKLIQHNCLKNVELIQDSHENMDYYINELVDGVMFNLGYLPGINSNLITLPKSTLIAVDKALTMLKLGGILTMVFYPGHEGGQAELDKVKDYLVNLSQKEFEVSQLNFINQINNPPQLIVVKKLRRGNK